MNLSEQFDYYYGTCYNTSKDEKCISQKRSQIKKLSCQLREQMQISKVIPLNTLKNSKKQTQNLPENYQINTSKDYQLVHHSEIKKLVNSFRKKYKNTGHIFDEVDELVKESLLDKPKLDIVVTGSKFDPKEDQKVYSVRIKLHRPVVGLNDTVRFKGEATWYMKSDIFVINVTHIYFKTEGV